MIAPCRLCGETQHLRLDAEGFERVAVIGGQVQEVIWQDGHPTNMETVDIVFCLVCDASAPRDVWNGTRPSSDYAALRDFSPEPLGTQP